MRNLPSFFSGWDYNIFAKFDQCRYWKRGVVTSSVILMGNTDYIWLGLNGLFKHIQSLFFRLIGHIRTINRLSAVLKSVEFSKTSVNQASYLAARYFARWRCSNFALGRPHTHDHTCTMAHTHTLYIPCRDLSTLRCNRWTLATPVKPTANGEWPLATRNVT